MYLVSITDPPQVSADGGPIFDVSEYDGQVYLRRPDQWRPATEDEVAEYVGAHGGPKTAAPRKRTARKAAPAKKAPAKKTAAKS